MDTKDQETAIAYQNKDIVSKLFGERMKGKPLSLFGLGTDLKVADVKPTNLPIVQARELRMDNLFELEDGSVAILDYESEYKKSNFTKYGRYIMECGRPVSERRERAGYSYDGTLYGGYRKGGDILFPDGLQHTDRGLLFGEGTL